MPIDLTPIKNQLAAYLFQTLRTPLVTGIAIGLLDAPPEQEIADQEILIFVEPVADCELTALKCEVQGFAKVSANSTNVPIRFLPTGRFVGLAPTTGGSVGFRAPTHYNLPEASVGTLGLFVDCRTAQFALGANHVFAHNGRVPSNADIVAPGTLDDPTGAGAFARLSYFVELLPASWPLNGGPPNQADCALARLTHPMAVANPVRSLTATPTRWIPVHKTGRTTHRTSSTLRVIHWEGYLDFDFGTYYFEELLGVADFKKPVFGFAAAGNSGSCVFSDAGSAVGLITARAYSSGFQNQYIGYIVLVSPMATILKQLDLPGKLRIPADEVKLFQG